MRLTLTIIAGVIAFFVALDAANKIENEFIKKDITIEVLRDSVSDLKKCLELENALPCSIDE